MSKVISQSIQVVYLPGVEISIMDIRSKLDRILRIVKSAHHIFTGFKSDIVIFQAVANRQQVGIQPAAGDIVVFNNGKDCFVVQPQSVEAPATAAYVFKCEAVI